ncbi:DUF2397 domain-containing protein [Streptomonospora nanhaiensis]|uniref:Uncharacterized protein (TIGR02677 family) n=1 Tax=Streptomonospora nanhaiensis TaxID=1323731 RepID=A0A853BKH5_9ACTN|nr:DUF2397 domain-containing protein [Streptomonospora nanhaiensis]MBV2362313.1 DUF2397 domain-containing protein [Streptomonospora nanhaiensis]MBX9388211.1 DUF2397 domain-containing protein [Streptomonospora nanhaiensis]NYI95032.1 uncharacterized protein (TIGR02677 family) [Streptomonospora nanhaiensis]
MPNHADDHPPGAAEQPADPTGAADRLRLYSYLTAPERRTYLAVMRLFTSTLMADLGAGEVAAALAGAERRGEIDPGESRLEVVVDRLEQLARWGNLVPGRREPAATIAEFTRSRVRYQVAKLAVRVQRDAEDVLEVAEGAREVSRELLPAIEQGLADVERTLDHLAASAAGRGPQAASARGLRERLAQQVTTLFLQHEEFAAAVRDFYAYLGSVIARYDLAPAEMTGFKHMLLEYVELIAKDVLRHSEPIVVRLGALNRRRAELLGHLGAGPGDDLAPRPARLGQMELMERAPGRRDADWDGLTGWFIGLPGRPSEVDALREATSRAITALFANVKRVTGAGGVDPGRRRDLLRLAAWFDSAEPEAAHDLYAAAFGLFSARHLALAPEDDSPDPARTWARGRRVDVEVNVRSRGERAPGGQVPRVSDDPLGRAALLEEEDRRHRRRAAAVGELSAAGTDLAGARLSGDALEVLCELLTLAGATRDGPADRGTAADAVTGLTVELEPRPAGRVTRIGSVLGDLELHGVEVRLRVDDPLLPPAGGAP